MPLQGEGIRGIIFDLDGTLYVSERFAAEITTTAAVYVAGVRGISHGEAEQLLTKARQRLAEENGAVPTISAACVELGGTVPELHRFFQATLRPEAYLVREQRVIDLLERLAGRFCLYIYTNNNRVLTTRILDYLGLSGLFEGVFTIEDEWRGKPDEEMVVKVLQTVGLQPTEALFVGDRYDIDLRVPEQLGCPVYLSKTVAQLLRLEELLNTVSSPATPL